MLPKACKKSRALTHTATHAASSRCLPRSPLFGAVYICGHDHVLAMNLTASSRVVVHVAFFVGQQQLVCFFFWKASTDWMRRRKFSCSSFGAFVAGIVVLFMRRVFTCILTQGKKRTIRGDNPPYVGPYKSPSTPCPQPCNLSCGMAFAYHIVSF